MALFDRRTAVPGASNPRPPRYGVLLVDDEVLNLTALAALLEEEYRVYTAANASAALAMLADPVIGPATQVVVSDQRMPGMSGVELLSRIRTLRPDIKGILLTGFTDVSAIIGAINEAGVYRYLQKPVEIHEMKMTLLRASEAWQLEQDNRDLVSALSRSYDKLAMLDAAKTSFLRYLAHEVNTPLNWLAATTVIDRHALGEESSRMLEYVDLGRQRLYGLVSAVLRYFEGAGLDLPLHVQPVDLSIMLNGLTAALRRRQDHAFALRLEAPPALVIESDREVLLEILGHLLENAVTHAVRGGDAPEVFVRLRDTGNGAEIEVHNSGAVPDSATVEQLFQPFFFCGSQHGEQGYGLSLATARALTLSLGGSLEASRATVTSGGLCLRVRLPADVSVVHPSAVLPPGALEKS